MRDVEIKIILTDEFITLDGKNLNTLTEDDINESVNMLNGLARILYILREGDARNGNA